MPVQWEDPPSVHGYPGLWQELRANPGRWARYPGLARGVYAAARNKAGAFEATVRMIDGQRVGFVRYVGPANVEPLRKRSNG